MGVRLIRGRPSQEFHRFLGGRRGRLVLSSRVCRAPRLLSRRGEAGRMCVRVGAIRGARRLFTGDDDLDVCTQVLWAGLQGLITLMRGGCLPRGTHERRIALLIDRFSV